MAAADDESDARKDVLRGRGQPAGVDVRLEMVDGDQGDSSGDADRFGGDQSDQQRSGQARGIGHGHGVEIGAGRCDRVVPETLARAREVLGFTEEQEAELRETAEKLAASVTQDLAPGKPKPVPSPAAKTASAPAAAAPSVAAKSAVPHHARLSLWRRLGRMFGGK